MKLPIIQSLWVGNDLSNIEKLCVQSFIDHGHEFHIYTYGELGGIPGGAIIKDAEQILPFAEATIGTQQNWSSLSDYFRYALLYKLGGYWVDMDSICVKPFDFIDEIIFSEDSFGSDWFPTCILRFPPKHPLIKTMLENSKVNVRKKNVKTLYVGGPPLLTEQIKKAKMENHVYPRMKFFDYNTKYGNFFNNAYRGEIHFTPTTHAIHIGQDFLARSGFDKNARFDSQSLFEQMKAKHGINNDPNAKHITSQEVNEHFMAKTKRKAKNDKKRKIRERVYQAIIIILIAVWFL